MADAVSTTVPAAEPAPAAPATPASLPVETSPPAPRGQTKAQARAERLQRSIAAANAERDAPAAGEPAPASESLGASEAAGTTGDAASPPPGEPAPKELGAQEPAEGSEDTPLTRTQRRELHELREKAERLERELQDARKAPEERPKPQAEIDAEVLAEIAGFIGRKAEPGSADYDTLTRLVRAKDHNALATLKRVDGLDGGYSLEEAIDQLNAWDGYAAIFDKAYGPMQRAADAQHWATIGRIVDEHVKDVGLDGQAIASKVAEARKAGKDPLAVYLTEIRKAERADAAEEWKGKHDALAAELKALRAEHAGSREQPEAGGGSGPLTGSAAVMSAFKRNRGEAVERALRGEFANVDLRDAG
jgi:hypothetical protein